ncbi:MAG: tRNA uridine(34) 5-carboxymethylaminomethyl modification radical SAM/GNAT enzyme Elp3 [Actinobacteria bacterium]|nr:tRNA uridine(34) 5-carboxymethylaminomethyl modification radical SAM/GNAT enzyme Elp3 [Actinomycetota bacterium]
METILLEIINMLKEANNTCDVDGAGRIDDRLLEKLLRKHNRNLTHNAQHHSKKKLMPFYLKVKESDPLRWAGWGIDQALEEQLLRILQIKPRRTASGVATITVLTKPWKCSSNCLYCPNDLTMPKSYLSDEPACQRAERNYFDPYLQVASRLRALTQMGHVTDKVELIILGGTWSDYPAEYQIWFVSELFRALNEGNEAEHTCAKRRAFYKKKGLSNQKEELAEFVREQQQLVNNGSLTYNQAWSRLYEDNDVWRRISANQVSTFTELKAQHTINEHSHHRVVGLVIETRPDAITCDSLKLLRQLGCTKIQMGIQSLNPSILKLNHRNISIDKIQEAFSLLRIFGFKIHAHFMMNLFGSSCSEDKRDYRRLVTEKPYLPDEVKLYPCVLVGGTKLCEHFADTTWQPYSEEDLIDVLVTDTLITPSFIRISRMIRDISAHDIVAGNKKVNLRQLVERKIDQAGENVSEIRYREISTLDADVQNLTLETVHYETTVTDEYFLQWVTPENKIAGFLRLSLPHADYVCRYESLLPVAPFEAMIREVHVYGKVAGLHETGKGAQHLGLGKQLIKEACAIAKDQSYRKINVISSVGTREYYRNLGFIDTELYQQMTL